MHCETVGKGVTEDEEMHRPQYGRYSGEEMNDWKGEQLSPSDTYIEWVFECKCRQISDGFRIITEWRKRKQQYVAVMRTITMDFQHYSRH